MATGNSFNFTHWDIGEPTATAGDEKSPEQCLEIRIVRGRLWWNDLNCKGLLGFICEIPLNDGSNYKRYWNKKTNVLILYSIHIILDEL